jgi:hypothetical protein
MAGFDGADHLDGLRAGDDGPGFRQRVEADYGRLGDVGIECVPTAGRATWLREFGEGIGEALERGMPVIGAGLCRAVERAAREDPRYWRERRLWDVLLDAGDARRPRASDSAYDQALRDVKARSDSLIDHPHHRYKS